MNSPDLVSQTVFCEHVRQEAQGLVSLIGIMPDNINILTAAGGQSLPAEQAPAIPSLALYTRIRLPLDRAPRGDVAVQFLSPSGQMILDGAIEKSFIDASIAEARDQGNEYVLIIQQANLANFPVLEIGRYVVLVVYAGETYFSGALRVSSGPG